MIIFQAGYQATMHLIELGHRHIGFIKDRGIVLHPVSALQVTDRYLRIMAFLLMRNVCLRAI